MDLKEVKIIDVEAVRNLFAEGTDEMAQTRF